MIPEAVYCLCALASAFCAVLLTRGYWKSKERLLLWSSWCFVMLAISNALLMVDLTILSKTVDLSVIRTGVTLIGVSLMLHGLIWESR